MTRRLARTALALSLLAAWAGPARGAESGLSLSAGLENRWFSDYFYFYGYPSSGHSETSGSAVTLALEGVWRFGAGEHLRFGPGLALGVGKGSADFTASGQGTSSQSATLTHAELFGEGGYAFTPRLTGLARLGIGYTSFAMDAARDEATDLLLAAGLELALTDRFALGLLYQVVLSNLSATTDAGVTSSSPGLESYSASALQTRVSYRF